MINTPILSYVPILTLIIVLGYTSLLDLRGRRVPVGMWYPWIATMVPYGLVMMYLNGSWSLLIDVALLTIVFYGLACFDLLGGGDVIGIAAALFATTLVIGNPYWALVAIALMYLVGSANVMAYRKIKGIVDGNVAMMPFILCGTVITVALSLF